MYGQSTCDHTPTVDKPPEVKDPLWGSLYNRVRNQTEGGSHTVRTAIEYSLLGICTMLGIIILSS